MKYWKPLMLAGAAASLLVIPAEAQVIRPPQTRRAVPRTEMPQIANPNEWRRFDSGIRRNDRNISVSFSYYSGDMFGIGGMIPYYMTGWGAIPGYFYGDIFYSLYAGPRPLTRWEIVNQQWYNISRFGPTIGDLRTMRYNMAAGIPYGPGMMGPIPNGYPPQGQVIENPVNEDLTRENEELKRQLEQYRLKEAEQRLKEAEQRGYERGKAEAQPVQPVQQQPVQPTQDQLIQQQPVQPAQEQPNVFPDYMVEYIEVCTEGQYDNVATGYANYVLNLARSKTRGAIDRVARDGGYGRLEIRDEKDNSLNTINYDELIKRRATTPEFISFLNKRLLERGIDPAYVGANVTFSSRSCPSR